VGDLERNNELKKVGKKKQKKTTKQNCELSWPFPGILRCKCEIVPKYDGLVRIRDNIKEKKISQILTLIV